jgi:alpha-tubulin suppressor-like RCC1 family protein
MRAHDPRAASAVLVAAALAGCPPAPVPAPPPERAPLPASLAAGELSSCALVRAEVRCWGTDPLDDGRGAVPGHGPWEPVVGVAVPGLSARDIAVGVRYGCAVRDDARVACWGRVDGDPFEPNPGPAPLTVQPGLEDIVDVAVGWRHGCAVTRAGRVSCWGAGGDGQLGDGTRNHSDIPVDTGLTDIAAVAAHARQTCALHRDGRVSCWGALTDDHTPTRSPFPVRWIEDAVEVAVGERPCVRHGDGRVECWTWTRLDGEAFSTPAEILGLGRPVRLALGRHHGCAVESDGRVKCWQWPGSASATPIPAYPVGGITGASEVAVGDHHSCARLPSEVVCWGDNEHGRLGDGRVRVAERPRKLDGLVGVVELDAGPRRTCARTRDGAVSCWGEKIRETMTIPARAESRGWSGTPTLVLKADDIAELDTSDVGVCTRHGSRLSCRDVSYIPRDIADVRAVDFPPSHGLGCWVSTTGRVSCLGYPVTMNCDGDGCPPREIADTTAIERLALGAHHGCAVDERGAVWCWGPPKRSRGWARHDLDKHAEREDGLPPVVGIAIGAGPAHTCAWSAAGELWCWGANHRGQLGDDTTEPRDTPTRVTIAGPAVAVAAGDAFTCAALADGRAQCWGANDQAQLGDGTRLDRHTPGPAVVDLPPIADLTAGHAHVCARTRDGDVYCWGQGNTGQLGQGTEPAHTTPLRVAGLE